MFFPNTLYLHIYLLLSEKYFGKPYRYKAGTTRTAGMTDGLSNEKLTRIDANGSQVGSETSGGSERWLSSGAGI